MTNAHCGICDNRLPIEHRDDEIFFCIYHTEDQVREYREQQKAIPRESYHDWLERKGLR